MQKTTNITKLQEIHESTRTKRIKVWTPRTSTTTKTVRVNTVSTTTRILATATTKNILKYSKKNENQQEQKE